MTVRPGSPSLVGRRIAKPITVAKIRWALGPRGFKSHPRRYAAKQVRLWIDIKSDMEAKEENRQFVGISFSQGFAACERVAQSRTFHRRVLGGGVDGA